MNDENLKKGVKTQFKSGEDAARKGAKGGRIAQENRRSQHYRNDNKVIVKRGEKKRSKLLNKSNHLKILPKREDTRPKMQSIAIKPRLPAKT